MSASTLCLCWSVLAVGLRIFDLCVCVCVRHCLSFMRQRVFVGFMCIYLSQCVSGTCVCVCVCVCLLSDNKDEEH